MNQTKCPHCGNIQNKEILKESLQMKMFIGFLESDGEKVRFTVGCKKCNVAFDQDKHTIENPIQKMAQKFVDKYYNYDVEEEDEKKILTEDDWIGREIGDVLDIGDCFFCVEFMQEALKFNASYDEVFDYYYDSIEAYGEKKDFPTFKKYLNKRRKK